MKSTMAAFLLAATSTFALAQSPADHERHHPAQNATPAPAQPTPQTQQGMGPSQGMMGGGMMKMMGGNMPMMNMMRMMGGMQQPGAGMGGADGGCAGTGGMATIDRVEGRIAFLRTELKITDAQTSAWNTFADALRANAKSLGEIRASMMSQAPQTLVDRVTLQEKWLAARLEGTRATRSALTNLVSTLSDEQKKTADELLAPHMGMMAMMSGAQPGGMGPGRMGPGQMMPGR